MLAKDRWGKAPPPTSIIGALQGLLLAENGDDIVDEVFFICDALGIERPVPNDESQRYEFTWTKSNEEGEQ